MFAPAEVINIQLGERNPSHLQDLANHKSVKSLSFWSLQPREREESYYWLRVVETLESLRIDGDEIGEETGKEIERLLDSGLKCLSIVHATRLPKSCAIRISNGLRRSKCADLTLRDCNIDDQILQVIADGLEGSSTIREMSFERNVGIVSPIEFAAILPTMKSLKYVSMNHCSISNKGAQHLLKAIQKTPSLVKLKIQVQTGSSRPIDSNILRNIYFYSRWNEIEGWKLWKDSSSVWSHALARLGKQRHNDIIFHLLHNRPGICAHDKEAPPAKRTKMQISNPFVL